MDTAVHMRRVGPGEHKHAAVYALPAVAREDITCLEHVACGATADVYRGRFHGSKVAVKVRHLLKPASLVCDISVQHKLLLQLGVTMVRIGTRVLWYSG